MRKNHELNFEHTHVKIVLGEVITQIDYETYN